MSIGTTLKQLRKARNLTQAELASHLGITSKAISQWECDRTSPDISQIPALCQFFQISADQLLNIDIPSFKEERQEILRRYYEFSRKGYLREGWDLLLNSLAKFPNDYTIMIHLAICGDRICKFSHVRCQEKDAIRKQCTEYCKRILDGCTDNLTRHAAVSTLCTFYAEQGETKKAEELASQMPVMIMSQEFLFKNIYQGTKKNTATQRLKSSLLQVLLKHFDANNKSDSDENLYSAEEIALLREKKIALLELLFENGDFGFYSGELSDFYEANARYYASVGNLPKALEDLEKSAILAIDFISFMQKNSFTHSSLFLKGMVETSKNISLNCEDNQAKLILKKMEYKEYELLRGMEKFKKISTLLEPFIETKL